MNRGRIGMVGVVGAVAMGVISAGAYGQIYDGTVIVTGISVSTYTVEFGGQVVGRVVVVGADNTNPPAGYQAGREYWTWTSGTPWRGAFKLVPASTVPSYAAYTWQTFPHERFDLSGTVPIPAVDPGVNDKFYKVSVQDGTSWQDQGYMWLDVGATSIQEWYGVDLTADVIGGEGLTIRFESVEPPEAGSLDVYLLE